MSDILVGQAPLEAAVQHVPLPGQCEGEVGLDVLVAGAVLPPNPAQVMESETIRSLLDKAITQYDLVVIDTPPLSLLPDAFPLLQRMDGVLIVSRLGYDRADVAAHLRETLARVEAPVLGVVANGYKQPRTSSSYSYGYRDVPENGNYASPAAQLSTKSIAPPIS